MAKKNSSNVQERIWVVEDNNGHPFRYSQKLTLNTSKYSSRYYELKKQIPEGSRMSTAAEELVIQLGLDRAQERVRYSDVYKSLLLGRAFGEFFEGDEFSPSISFAAHLTQYTDTGLRVPKGWENGRYQIDAKGNMQFPRIVLIGDQEVGEVFVPERGIVTEWNEVFGIPSEVWVKEPRKRYATPPGIPSEAWVSNREQWSRSPVQPENFYNETHFTGPLVRAEDEADVAIVRKIEDGSLIVASYNRDSRNTLFEDYAFREVKDLNVVAKAKNMTENRVYFKNLRPFPLVYFDVRELPLGVTIGGRTVGCSVAPKSPRYLELQEDVDAEITDFAKFNYRHFDYDFAKEFKDLHSGSITVQSVQKLKNYWLLSEAGEVQLRHDQRVILNYLFNKFEKGFVCDNGVDYNDQGDLPEKEGFARAAIITAPKRFYKEGDKWKVERGDIDPVHDYIPAKGFPILTNDGEFNPVTGMPFETDPQRAVAEESYTRKGVSPDVARKAVSKFLSRNEGQGVAVVDAPHSKNHHGYDSFSLNACSSPGDRGIYMGRLASRPRTVEQEKEK